MTYSYNIKLPLIPRLNRSSHGEKEQNEILRKSSMDNSTLPINIICNFKIDYPHDIANQQHPKQEEPQPQQQRQEEEEALEDRQRQQDQQRFRCQSFLPSNLNNIEKERNSIQKYSDSKSSSGGRSKSRSRSSIEAVHPRRENTLKKKIQDLQKIKSDKGNVKKTTKVNVKKNIKLLKKIMISKLLLKNKKYLTRYYKILNYVNAFQKNEKEVLSTSMKISTFYSTLELSNSNSGSLCIKFSPTKEFTKVYRKNLYNFRSERLKETEKFTQEENNRLKRQYNKLYSILSNRYKVMHFLGSFSKFSKMVNVNFFL
nr:MAG: hypothetical protein [Porcellio scaber clopovirus]